MKKFTTFIFAVVLAFAAKAQTNDTMFVHTKQTVHEFATKDVDSITPILGTTQDTDSLYIHRNNTITNRFRVDDIDSIIFYRPGSVVVSVLSVPQNLIIAGSQFSWNPVENAIGYSVEISGYSPQSVTGTTFDLSKAVAAPGTYTVRVRAVGDEITYLTSNWSEWKTYLIATAAPGFSLTVGNIIWASVSVDVYQTFAAKPDMITKFYQWNRETAWAATGTVSGWNSTADPSPTWTINPCPKGWRLPTRAEVNELNSAVDRSYAAAEARGNAVIGFFLGPNHATCGLPDNMNGCIFLSAGRSRSEVDGNFPEDHPISGRYWTSTQADNVANGILLNITDASPRPTISASGLNKGRANNIRCVTESHAVFAIDSCAELGHVFGYYIPDGNATCLEDGTETATCQRIGCRETLVRSIANSALGHDFVLSEKIAPTCELQGYDSLTCSRCPEYDLRNYVDALAAPTNLNISNGTLTWDEVADATGYVVDINGSTEATIENSFDLTGLTANTYTIKVKATINIGNRDANCWSDPISYIVTKLSTPINLTILVADHMLSWNSVPNAIQYMVDITGAETKTELVTDTCFNLSALSTHGFYTLKVQALGNGNTFLDSDWSVEEIYYVGDGTLLSAPTNLQITGTTLSWDPVSDATGYTVEVVGVKSENVGESILEFDLATMVTATGAYSVRVRALGDGVNIIESAWTYYGGAANRYIISEMLETPIVSVEYDALKWNKVPNATEYVINIEGKGDFPTTDTIFDLRSFGPGIYTYKVQARADGVIYTPSEWTTPDNHTISALLEAPIITITGTELSWCGDINSVSYVVNIDGKDSAVLTSTFDLQYLTEIGNYIIKVKAIGDGIIYMNSYWSDEKTYIIATADPGPSSTAGTALQWASVNIGEYKTFAERPDMHTMYYQWNRITAWPASGTVSGWNATPDPSDTWMVNPCPEGWRMPTRAEVESLRITSAPGNNNSWAAAGTRGNAVAGIFVGPNHATCALPNNMNGCIFLSAGGWRGESNGNLSSQGTVGRYWTTTEATNTANGMATNFDNAGLANNATSTAKGRGHPIRCVTEIGAIMKLSAPINFNIEDDILKWTPVPNATGYKVFDGVDTKDVPTGTSFDLSYLSDISLGSHTLKVQAIGNGTTHIHSAWSEDIAHTASVQLEKPVISISGNTLSWGTITNATGYTVDINGSTEHVNAPTTDYVLTGLIANTYIIKVQAIGNGSIYRNSEWSETEEYVVAKLAAPINLDIIDENSEDLLVWDPVSNAISYKVNIRDEGAYDETHSNITGVNFNLTVLNLPNALYYITVQAIGNGYTFLESDWSNERNYLVGSGVALDPPTGVNISGSMLSWISVSDAIGYDIEVLIKGTHDVKGVYGAQHDATNYDLDGITTDPGIYTVRIRARGDEIDFFHSNWVSYTEDYIISATLTDPIITITNDTLRWNAVENAISYKVSIVGRSVAGQYPTTTDTFFNLRTLTGIADVYTITVQAVGDGIVNLSSDESNARSYLGATMRVGNVVWASLSIDEYQTFATRPDMMTMYYQWNRITPWATTGTISDWPQGDEPTTWDVNPCPDGWRLPTRAESEALSAANLGNTWVAAGDRGSEVNGMFFGPNHATCSLPDNMNGCIFLWAGGWRHETSGNLTSQGTIGRYWTTNVSGTNAGMSLNFQSPNAATGATGVSRLRGHPIRCVQQ